MKPVKDRPSTLAEARKYRYGAWAGYPSGNPYREGFCIKQVFSTDRGHQHHQCANRLQKGTPWCAIHQPGAAEARAAKRPPTRYERDVAAMERREQEAKKFRRYEKALRAITRESCICGGANDCAAIARKALGKVKAR